MFPDRNNPQCHGAHTNFYSHSAFLTAAASFPAFATSSDAPTNKRELAAFLAHISAETGGLCWIIEGGAGGPPADRYCQPGQYPCAPGKSYHGRGPIQLSWNYNYFNAGKALGFDGINNPDAVGQDPVLAFRTALWFWMTPHSPKPSAHDVMTGRWTPAGQDAAAGRSPGFGMVINIINGGLECGKGTPSDQETSRIALYNRMASALGVSTGPNTSCAGMRPY
jgi:chitinase